MRTRGIAVAALAALLVTGCADMQDRQRQTAGALIGGAAGGLAGAQFGSGSGQLAATALGTLLGAYAGSEVGRSMDDVDRMRAEQAYNQALTQNRPIQWENPRSGNYGYVEPTRSGTIPQTGQRCQEFRTAIYIDGQPEYARGVACQQPDGTWRVTQ